ncbi:MAG: FtsX-like permease family protein, partial [Burkholderiaceae bacterium]|nr:FtsX-like permease family protein [Burkholderiaceae bacterium]
LADPDLRELFALRAVAGDLAAAMASPEGVALTEAAALKLFGTTQALGRQLTAAVSLYGEAEPRRLEVTLTVMAILPSPNPHGTLGSYDALAGINAPAAKEFVAQETSWTFSAGHLYARLQPGATAALLTQQAQHLLDQQPLPPDLPADFLKGGGKFAYLRALPVADIALHGAGSPLRRLQLGSLALAAAGVLGLAVINFVNLWGVRTLRRQREIGLRKSLGAGAAQLAAQFFIEALAVAGLAGALGLLLAWWSEPVAAALLQQSFTAPLLSAASLGLTALLCVAIATASALPLTLIALRVRPAASLAGRSHSEGTASRWLRRTMTALQFGTAAVFSALSLTVLWQVAHAGRIDRGFDVRGRVAVSLPWQAQAAQTRALLTRIQAWPEVTAAAASDDVPGRDFARWFSEYRGPNGQPLNLRRGGDFTPGLLQLYGMRLRAGQLSVDHAAEVAQHGVVLDVRATRALGFGSPSAAIGQRLSPSNPDRPAPTVVAVIDDIRLEGARDAP